MTVVNCKDDLCSNNIGGICRSESIKMGGEILEPRCESAGYDVDRIDKEERLEAWKNSN